MSYSIRLVDAETKEHVVLDNAHLLKGGTYALGGTKEAWLNVTYNYADIFYKVLGEKGIRSIYGLTGKDSIMILSKAISVLKDDVSDNYWEATEGNVRKALSDLLQLAIMKPDAIWDGD